MGRETNRFRTTCRTTHMKSRRSSCSSRQARHRAEAPSTTTQLVRRAVRNRARALIRRSGLLPNNGEEWFPLNGDADRISASPVNARQSGRRAVMFVNQAAPEPFRFLTRKASKVKSIASRKPFSHHTTRPGLNARFGVAETGTLGS